MPPRITTASSSTAACNSAPPVRYFSYGANMARSVLAKRGVTPLSSEPAVVADGTIELSFSHRGGYATLHQPSAAALGPASPASATATATATATVAGAGAGGPAGASWRQPHGVLHTLSAEDLHKLQAREVGYHLTTLQVQPYGGGDQACAAAAFVSSPLLRLYRPVPPPRCYRDLLLEGGRQQGLDPRYLEWLQGQEVAAEGPRSAGYDACPADSVAKALAAAAVGAVAWASLQAILSLLLSLVLGCGSMLWWSAGVSLSGGSPAPALQFLRPRDLAFEHCERAQLDIGKLDEWGCKVFSKACFDQANMLLHSGEKTPGHPLFTSEDMFEVKEPPVFVLPGYEEPLGSAHWAPKTWSINIRAPTPMDPPDVWQPKEFTNCTVPLVWWPSYFSIFGEGFLSSAALSNMLVEGAFDRNVTLAPVTYGMDVMPWYGPMLHPYSRFKVESLSSLSSREHIITGRPRCYERAILCNLVGLYIVAKTHDWRHLLPKTVGRRAVEHYRREFPERFRQQEEQAAQDGGTVLRVAFMPRSQLRQIVNLEETLEECKQWAPPADTKFKKMDCVVLPDGTPDNFIDLVAAVQNVHALVNTHGSGNNFCWFMPNGTALIEILPWNFHGKGCTWADQYFSDCYSQDHSVDSGYFRLVADKKHTFMGPYEKNNTGSVTAYARDQDVAIDFPTLAKVLERIAHGKVSSTPHNLRYRTFFMTQEDRCPGAIQYQEEQKRIKEEEKERKSEVKAQQLQEQQAL